MKPDNNNIINSCKKAHKYFKALMSHIWTKHRNIFLASLLLIVLIIFGQAFFGRGALPPIEMNIKEEAWVTNGDAATSTRSLFGNTIIGGNFNMVGPATGAGVLTNPDSGDVTNSWKINGGEVRASIPDGSGGYYVGGSFLVNLPDEEGTISNLIHIQADGAIDTRFRPSSVLTDGLINNIVLGQLNGQQVLYVGGLFSNPNLQGVFNLLVFNLDGSEVDISNERNSWPINSISTEVSALYFDTATNILYAGRLTDLDYYFANQTDPTPFLGALLAFDTSEQIRLLNWDTYIEGRINDIEKVNIPTEFDEEGRPITTVTSIVAGGRIQNLSSSQYGVSAVEALTAGFPPEESQLVNLVPILSDRSFAYPEFTFISGSAFEQAFIRDIELIASDYVAITGAFSQLKSERTLASVRNLGIFRLSTGEMIWNAGIGGVTSSKNSFQFEGETFYVDPIKKIHSIQQASNGILYFGGEFDSFLNNPTRKYGAAVTYNSDTLIPEGLSNWDPRTSGQINAFSSDRKVNANQIFVGGNFFIANGVTRNGLAELDQNGVVTTTTFPNLVEIFEGKGIQITRIIFDETSNILYVLGNFCIEGETICRLGAFRYNPNFGGFGTVNFNSFFSTNEFGRLSDMVLMNTSDGVSPNINKRLFVGGTFSTGEPLLFQNLIALDPETGVLDETMNFGITDDVTALSTDGSKLFVAAQTGRGGDKAEGKDKKFVFNLTPIVEAQVKPKPGIGNSYIKAFGSENPASNLLWTQEFLALDGVTKLLTTRIVSLKHDSNSLYFSGGFSVGAPYDFGSLGALNTSDGSYISTWKPFSTEFNGGVSAIETNDQAVFAAVQVVTDLGNETADLYAFSKAPEQANEFFVFNYKGHPLANYRESVLIKSLTSVPSTQKPDSSVLTVGGMYNVFDPIKQSLRPNLSFFDVSVRVPPPPASITIRVFDKNDREISNGSYTTSDQITARVQVVSLSVSDLSCFLNEGSNICEEDESFVLLPQGGEDKSISTFEVSRTLITKDGFPAYGPYILKVKNLEEDISSSDFTITFMPSEELFCQAIQEEDLGGGAVILPTVNIFVNVTGDGLVVGYPVNFDKNEIEKRADGPGIFCLPSLGCKETYLQGQIIKLLAFERNNFKFKLWAQNASDYKCLTGAQYKPEPNANNTCFVRLKSSLDLPIDAVIKAVFEKPAPPLPPAPPKVAPVTPKPPAPPKKAPTPPVVEEEVIAPTIFEELIPEIKPPLPPREIVTPPVEPLGVLVELPKQPAPELTARERFQAETRKVFINLWNSVRYTSCRLFTGATAEKCDALFPILP